MYVEKKNIVMNNVTKISNSLVGNHCGIYWANELDQLWAGG